MTDLLSAVHALTRPTHRKIIQEVIDGPEATRLVPIVDDPLLQQLDDAIRSSMGGNTRGGSDPRTRSVMNLGAYEVAKGIEAKVHGWARMAGAVVDKDSLPATLEHWHVKFIGNALMDNHDGHTKILRGWAAQIVATLDPPIPSELPQNCPACGSDCWWNAEEKASYTHPLIRTRREGEPVDNARGFCRACKKVWNARELAYELEQAEGLEVG